MAKEQQKILVVDDERLNINVLVDLLKPHYKMMAAKNGEQALKAVQIASPPDLILLDIMMPEMDGYEAMSLIRKQSRFQKLPILALTAKAMKDDRAKCLEAGANDYCSKPIDMGKLTSLMRVWLHK